MADNPQAFPMASASAHCGQYDMTLRDWFAGQALAGLTSNQTWLTLATQRSGQDTDNVAADASYEFADAMLAARALGKEG